MDNEPWKQARFKEAGVKPLTREQRVELSDKRDKYFRDRLKLQQEINAHKLEISKLESQIQTEMPSISNATNKTLVHSDCQLRTAIYYGRAPEGGLTGGENLAYCLFCDKEYKI